MSRWPVMLPAKGKKKLARIYKRPQGGYRLYWRVREADGKPKSRMRDFVRYSEAKQAGDQLVSDLAKGSRVTALTPAQASDALAALQCLQTFYAETGKRLSLLESVASYCGGIKKLDGRSLAEAVDGYLSTVAPVKRMDLLQAAEEFIASRAHKTVSENGERPELSAGYAYNFNMWLREFANTFPGHAVCDLTKKHLDTYIKAHMDVGPKSRNERRGVVQMFLTWCVRKDYLPATHRLIEADGMVRERARPGDIQCYTAAELQAMLERASRAPASAEEGEEPAADYRALLPIIALCGLGGIRLQEVVRLSFQDIFHIAGHIEISRGKAKTRQRRLVTVNSALAQWLATYKGQAGPLWSACLDHFHRMFEAMLAEIEIKPKRNGLRHSFISAHYALHADEGLTAKEAGTSPAMLHANYKGLLMKKEGEAWFGVVPHRPANIIPLTAGAP